MTTLDPATSTAGDTVELRTPATVAFVSTLRLAATSLASRCELTIDDIEDLQLAVDEACALLLPHALEGSLLDVHFTLATGRLVVATTVDAPDGAEPDREGFGWTVLRALVSSVEVTRDGHRLTITVTKARQAAQK